MHVFVESNWIYDAFAPSHLQKTEARRLLARAASAELTLHLPHVCLKEGADAIRQKCKPRIPHELSSFRRHHTSALSPDEHDAVSRFVDLYTTTVNRELEALDDALKRLRSEPGVEVFALDEDMLARAIELRAELQTTRLKPFDEAILAAVLVRARRLGPGAIFCTTDGDLRPWDKRGKPIRDLESVYEAVGLDVRRDFVLDDDA